MLRCWWRVNWSVPAVLLILYGLAVAVPGFRGGVMLLARKHDPFSGACARFGRGPHSLPDAEP